MPVSSDEFRKRMRPIESKPVAADPRLRRLGWISLAGTLGCAAATIVSFSVDASINYTSPWVPEFDQGLFTLGFGLIEHLAVFLLLEQAALVVALLFLVCMPALSITGQRTLLWVAGASWLNILPFTLIFVAVIVEIIFLIVIGILVVAAIWGLLSGAANSR